MTSYSSTYSPDDNKIRLYASSRLDAELYNRVKAAGFKWAPKQDLFVAPMWTPAREDLMLELCGEIEDEDKSLVERAEERAERFEDYSEKRGNEAESARKMVSSIADNIPFGQPILVGHHSERRARKDAERITNGMRKAVQLWETSSYWKSRAAGALQNAKYKELPAVRHRRIKGLEADMRKAEKNRAEAEQYLNAWSKDGLTFDEALAVANVCWLHLPRKEGDREDFNQCPTAHSALTNAYPSLYAPRTLDEVVNHAQKTYPRHIAHYSRWIAHYENRLAYERAMLDEAGGLAANRFEIQVGGEVLVRGQWVAVRRVNKKAGLICSVTTSCRYVPVRGIDEIADYREPSAEQLKKAQAAAKTPPMVNFPGEGFAHMTKEQFEKVPKDYKGSQKFAATETAGAYRVRVAMGVYATPGERDMNKRHSYPCVYITDAKRVDPPAAPVVEAVEVEPVTPQAELLPVVESVEAATVETAPEQIESQTETTAAATPKTESQAEAFAALRAQLRAGVQVVSAPQLFPTPATLAARMVDVANIPAGARVLEPSAGTGAILAQFPGLSPFGASYRHTWAGDVVAVEINHTLADNLQRSGLAKTVLRADFLDMRVDPSALFDRVLMNPPFQNLADVVHIKHAFGMLKPGGKLVAICANGPRQNDQLRPLVEACGGLWEELPANTFAESGTNVNTVLLTLNN